MTKSYGRRGHGRDASSVVPTRRSWTRPGYDARVTANRVPIPAQILDGSVVAIGRGLDPATVVRVGEGLAAGHVGAFEITLGRPGALRIDRCAA